MGLFDFGNKKRMHLQLHGNFRDAVRFEELKRRRRWFYFLDLVAIVSAIIGYYQYQAQAFTNAYWAFGITLVIVFYLVLRKINRKRHKQFNRFRRR
ncbi:MAG: hypothetical protein WCK29_00175 [archaeon]